jgi:hypothetical protein
MHPQEPGAALCGKSRDHGGGFIAPRGLTGSSVVVSEQCAEEALA